MIDHAKSGATSPGYGPYKGLTHFTEADPAFFFGRGEQRDLIVASLKSARLTLVYGQSGAGKSSLLRAGVAASLREAARRDMHRFGTAEFVPVVFSSWRDDPVAGIAAAIEGIGAGVRASPQSRRTPGRLCRPPGQPGRAHRERRRRVPRRRCC